MYLCLNKLVIFVENTIILTEMEDISWFRTVYIGMSSDTAYGRLVRPLTTASLHNVSLSNHGCLIYSAQINVCVHVCLCLTGQAVLWSAGPSPLPWALLLDGRCTSLQTGTSCHSTKLPSESARCWYWIHTPESKCTNAHTGRRSKDIFELWQRIMCHEVV